MAALYRIYMDDSGNVDATASNHFDLRYGSMTAVILQADYLDEKFNPDFEALVRGTLGEDNHGRVWGIHRRLLTGGKCEGPYTPLADANIRAEWDAKLLQMFDRAQYDVITACVDKIAWYYKYPNWTGDFYETLVQCVLERCFYYMRNRGVAEVNIEWKSPDRNDAISAAFHRAMEVGYPPHLSGEKLRAVFTSREVNILKRRCYTLDTHPAGVRDGHR